ncbi:lipase family protein [Flavimaricola marinus]|uniref:Alpha/beta hydrolase family protein n=1 Tax=Flavimaricola marinus TaxID=1819565 RepID=A0A238L8L8_9RHOB|nr:lipase family protein [Flavimaricola marinus]SMY06008.1 hypothetical protein LOM8899_00129 [Flavimaricola marinus]
MRQMQTMTAAALARASYLGAGALPPIRAALDRAGVQAWLLSDDTLIIPGTNHWTDWIRFNLNTMLVAGQQVGWNEVGTCIGNAKWHRGFAVHARAVHDFLNGRRPKYIIGHSLGAASAQILGCHYGVPTMCFASPNPRFGGTALSHEGWVLNVVYNDDPVGRFPLQINGYRRIGSVEILARRNLPGLQHSMDRYIPMLADEIAGGSLHTAWPPGP